MIVRLLVGIALLAMSWTLGFMSAQRSESVSQRSTIDKEMSAGSSSQGSSKLRVAENSRELKGSQADDSVEQGAPKTSSGPALSLRQCLNDLRDVTQTRERHSLELATLRGELQARDELTQLSRFSEHFHQYEVTFGAITGSTELNTRDTFSVCLSKSPSKMIREGDLVVAQGVLLGEVARVLDQCVTVRATQNAESSFEVKLAQSGVLGVAVGLGERSGEETVDAMMRLKYLERTQPALIGERVYLAAHPAVKRSSTDLLFGPLPQLVVGEVLTAHIEENGLFQEATITSPLKISGVKWVSVISLPVPAQDH